jgi:hypothetical protein
MSPRYSKEEIWLRITNLCGSAEEFRSVARRKKYRIHDFHDFRRDYSVMYESGRTKKVALDEFYGVYETLYRNEVLPRDGLRQHHKFSHAPGASVFALLMKVDNNVQFDGRALRITTGKRDGDFMVPISAQCG